jgi:hypothetical protein
MPMRLRSCVGSPGAGPHGLMRVAHHTHNVVWCIHMCVPDSSLSSSTLPFTSLNHPRSPHQMSAELSTTKATTSEQLAAAEAAVAEAAAREAAWAAQAQMALAVVSGRGVWRGGGGVRHSHRYQGEGADGAGRSEGRGVCGGGGRGWVGEGSGTVAGTKGKAQHGLQGMPHRWQSVQGDLEARGYQL